MKLPVLMIVPFLCTALLFLACEKRTLPVREKAVQKKELAPSILFVFGKDFFMYADLFAHINERYDSASLKEKISIISYNDMTVKTKQPRFALITEQLAARPADAVITLGIPEGGARILRTVKEQYPDLPVITLLPVEEILPLEAYSTIVADFELPDSLLESDRAVDIPAQDLQILMLAAVLTAEQMAELPEQTPFQRFSRAVNTAAALTAPSAGQKQDFPYTVKPYKDPELNIYSFNYLIVSNTEQRQGGMRKEAAGE
ncbi:MAG: hypothetical protein P1P65_10085 [Treponema sp.]